MRRVRGLEKPQQPIFDWILRETGTDQWFGEMPGMIALEADSLRVYHVPEMHEAVEEIVDRFVNPDLGSFAVSVRLITIEHVDWRSTAWSMLRPVPVTTPGVEAWLVSREDSAMLVAGLRQRFDVREHNSGNLQIAHGQTHTIERWVPRSYRHAVTRTPDRYPGYQVEMGQMQEGYSLQISPLAERDGRSMDVAVRCSVEQIERLTPVWLKVPTTVDPGAQVQVDIPQVASWRINERFRWPVDEILVVSRGVVAMPGLKKESGFVSPLASLPIPVPGGGPSRAEALLIFECRRIDAATPEPGAEPRVGRLNYHGRY